uniref:Fibronectin type-III domain-containing protein n=1 Tax=Amphiprion percula TaxID=161767 RepID=A0A3P8RYA8_AMPPE
MASVGGFNSFHIVVTDSGWLLEPQEFTVPGNQSHLDIWGLITGIGYEVRLTGVSESGLLSRPLTTVAVTGNTHSALAGLSIVKLYDPVLKFHCHNMAKFLDIHALFKIICNAFCDEKYSEY